MMFKNIKMNYKFYWFEKMNYRFNLKSRGYINEGKRNSNQRCFTA